jgi:diguanylate cyclase (GGDEF)-like protein
LSPTILVRPPDHSCRTTIRTIVILFGIVLVGIWAAVAFSLVTSRRHAVEHADSQGRNLMLAFRAEIALILGGVEGEMHAIAERLREERDNFDLYAWGRKNVLVLPGMAQATFVGPDGKLKSTTIEPHPSTTELGDRAHFRVHLDGKFPGLYIGKPVVGRISGAPILPISRRIEAEDGSFLGVLVVLLTPGALSTLPKSIDLGEHGAMTLAGLDHEVLVRFSADSPDGTKGIGTSLAGSTRPVDITENAEGRYARPSPIDGITRIYTYGRVGKYPLVVTVGLDLDQVLAEWRSNATTLVALAFGASLLLVGFAAQLIRQVLRDASAAYAARREITHTAEHDFLTGLPNRLLLNDRLSQAIAMAQRRQNKLAVLFLDLDGFKQINDSLGHQTGDKLLQSVANRLVACVRSSDTVSRQGGDEFVALLSEIREPEDAALTANKMLEAVAQAHSIDQHELCVSISIGVSIYPDDGLDAETLVKHADAAMYEAKERGRRCYRFFTPAINLATA